LSINGEKAEFGCRRFVGLMLLLFNFLSLLTFDSTFCDVVNFLLPDNVVMGDTLLPYTSKPMTDVTTFLFGVPWLLLWLLPVFFWGLGEKLKTLPFGLFFNKTEIVAWVGDNLI
jgi:hypothetical protein